MPRRVTRTMQKIDPALSQWIRARIAEGHDRASVTEFLREHGYSRALAHRATGLVFAAHAAELGQAAPDTADAGEDEAPEAYPEADINADFVPAHPLLGAEGNRIPCDHGEVRVLAACKRPYAFALANLLTPEECAGLIDYGRSRLRRARVVGADDGGKGQIDPRRTAQEAQIALGETALVARIDRRIQALTGVPASHGEGLLVMRYGVGGEYQPHYDYFTEDAPGERSHLDRGQRVATLVIYLNDVEAGGETIFPEAGFSIAPQAGNACYFAYMDAAQRMDASSFHGGAPVRAGEKWIATKWLRDRPYIV